MSASTTNDTPKCGPTDPIYRRITEQIFQYLRSHLTVSDPYQHNNLHCYIAGSAIRSLQSGAISICDGPCNPNQRTFTIVSIHYDGTVCHYQATGHMPSSHKMYKPVGKALTELQLAEILQHVRSWFQHQPTFGPLCGTRCGFSD